MLIDLQLHSTYSDGYLSPTELADFMQSKGVKVASLTDHNTVGGLDEFNDACLRRGIKPITGLELYVKYKHRHFNALWFNFDSHLPRLHEFLRATHLRRRVNVRRALAKLAKNGFKFSIEEILDQYSRYIPINHIVDDILASEYNKAKVRKELKLDHPREEDVIGRYLKNKQTSYLRESYVSLERVIGLKKEIGGQIIINHPGKYGHFKHETIASLKRAGLDGIEVLSPHHSVGAVMYFQHIARTFDFIATGGSDFHRFEGGRAKVQDSWNYFKINSSHLRKIRQIIG